RRRSSASMGSSISRVWRSSTTASLNLSPSSPRRQFLLNLFACAVFVQVQIRLHFLLFDGMDALFNGFSVVIEDLFHFFALVLLMGPQRLTQPETVTDRLNDSRNLDFFLVAGPPISGQDFIVVFQLPEEIQEQ